MFEGFERESLRAGLADVVRRARASGISPIVIRIVGGAAIRLVHFERDITSDIDARIAPVDRLKPIIDDVASAHGWPDTWLNDDVDRAGYLPDDSRVVAWITLYSDEAATIQAAPADLLLAMKLRALDERGALRDAPDVILLSAMCGVSSVADAHASLTRYFPDATLSTATIDLLAFHIGRGLPAPPPSLPALVWGEG